MYMYYTYCTCTCIVLYLFNEEWTCEFDSHCISTSTKDISKYNRNTGRLSLCSVQLTTILGGEKERK